MCKLRCIMNFFNNKHEMSDREIIGSLLESNISLMGVVTDLLSRIPHPHHEYHKKSKFTFQFLNYKFSSMSNAVLTVPTGTPVTGFNTPVDVKGNILPDAAYKVGSCVYGVITGPSGNPPGFTVAPGAKEEAFVVTETAPGSANDGIITFDAQDVNGVQLPQSQGTLSFTATAAVAVGSAFNFDQTTH